MGKILKLALASTLPASPGSAAAPYFMKKLSIVLTVLGCVPALATAQVVEQIVARVNNQIISSSEYDRSKQQLKDEIRQQNTNNADQIYSQREKDVLRDLIDQQLLLEKGKDLGITADTDLIKREDEMRKEMKLDSIDALEKEAAKQGIAWEDFQQNMRNQIITQKVIGQEVGSHLSISAEEQQQFYDQHKNEMQRPEAVRLSEILIAPKPVNVPAAAGATPDANAASASPNAQAPAEDAARQAAEAAALSAAEAKANDLLKQIRAGASFDEIAKKYSDGPSAAEGGALGVFERGKLAKALEDKTFAMKAGDVSDVIRTKEGFIILRVDEHQSAGIPPMKEVLPRIEDALYYQKLQPALRAYLTKLREDTYVKVYPGYVDTGASPNETLPVETSAAKEADAKKLKKKHKKMGVL
jgi:peptidyl-prolyl cis-trans isomerase SurA